MNVASAIGYQPPVAPIAPVARVDNPEPAVDDSVPNDTVTSTQFSALLALLAANSPKGRADMLRNAKPDDVALLDRLLNGSLLTGNAKSKSEGLSDSGTANTANTNAALDAVRYGMLNEMATGILSSTVTTPPATVANEATARRSNSKGMPATDGTRKHASEERLQGLARALQSVKAPTRGLTRAAEVHGTSVEELLALGDKPAANVRSMIDALLSKAGTPEGSLLANGDATSASTSTAELMAFATALAAARSASAADVATPVTDTAALRPELRAKLDRVIARMQSEFGHDVQIVETARSPERQAELYAQGRTTPGDVVTWTLDSAHLRGAAADVVVDGSWNNAEGFARLQRIAREEGLRTLGARDPGHLELMTADESADAAPRNTMRAVDTATNNGAAGIARVAGVASVATVGVAATTVRARSEERAPSAAERLLSSATQVAATPSESRTDDAASNDRRRDARDGSRDGVRDRGRDAKSASSRDGAFPAYGDAQNANIPHNSSASASDRPAPAVRLDSAERVANANALRDDAPAKALSQMTLEVDGPGGDAQKITVDMRGNTVSTHIATDAVSADRLRARVGELQGALEQHGLQSDVVRITAPAVRSIDAAEQVKQAASVNERDALRLAGAAGSNAGDGASQQGPRDRQGAARDWEKHNDARSARDEQRQGNSQRNRRGPNYEEL